MGAVATIHEDVIEEHFGRAASLYTQRHLVARSRAVRLADLAKLDARLRAHLDALVAAGDAGRAIIGDGSRWRGAARAFVMMVLAGYRGDRDAIEEIVAEHADEEHEPGLIAAIGWLSPRFVGPILDDWLAYHGPRWRALALAGHVAHRLDPRGAVVRGVQFDQHPAVRREAVRGCGVLGFRSLAPVLRRLYDGGSGLLRFLIARALLQLREPDAPGLLWRCACEGREWSEVAAELAARYATPHDARRRIEQIAALTRLSRVRIVAAAATGRATFARYLLDALEDPELAALAAYGLSTTFGLNLEAQQLALEQQCGPDPELPLPDVDGVRRWWAEARHRFDADGRWLLARPLDPHQMRHALWHGPQRLRVLVAHDLHWLLGGDRVPFEIDAPGWRQHRRLAAAMRSQRSSS